MLEKSFQALCRCDNGSLPISYTLWRPNSPPETRVVRNPGEQAIFNVSALYKASDINKLICHAKNSRDKPAEVKTLSYTNIIGMLGCVAHGSK